MWELCKRAEKKNYHISLVGARENVRKNARDVLQQAFPQLIFSETPHITFVALGAPKQEFAIDTQRRMGAKGVYMGVGGAFDMIAGHTRRAPKLFRMSGLEWMWRLLLQPSRILRIWRAVVIFPLTVLWHDR